MHNSIATRMMATLGLLAGSLAIAPATHAQIAVEGGNTSGQAAFFVPSTDAEGNVRLFDVNLRTLRLETSNGTTSTAVFTPRAASFDDVDASGTPNASDTGTFQGTLSGVAYTTNGVPIPFSGTPTVLNYSLTSFTNNVADIDGSLIRSNTPGDAPLVFLPGVDSVNVVTSGFSDIQGTLEVGDFAADIDDGAIALPSSLELRNQGGTVTLPSTAVTGRVQYRFRGENVTPEAETEFDFADGDIRFVGGTNREYRIRSAGETRGRDGFKFDIRADVGAVDITLGEDGAPLDESFREIRLENGPIDPTQPLDRFDIDGDAEGIFAFYNPTVVGFSSTDRNDTKFRFEQGDATLRGRTADDGVTTFFAAAGVDDLESAIDFDSFDFDTLDFTTGAESSCNTCGTSLVTGETFTVGATTITVGSPVVVVESDDDDDDNESITAGSNVTLVTVSPTSTVLFSPIFSGTATYQYQFLSAYRFSSVTTSQSQVRVRYVQQGGDRYYVVLPGRGQGRGRGVITAFRQVGPTARIFPGLVGLTEVDTEELENLVLVGLEEIDDSSVPTDDDSDFDDDSDDLDDDLDDDSDDDADDLDDDSDDLDDDSDDDSNDLDDSDDDSDDLDDDSDDLDDSDDDSDDLDDDSDDLDDSDDDDSDD